MQNLRLNRLAKIVWRSVVVPILLSVSLFGVNPVNIMPLGDSITKGYIVSDPANESGYRGPLWTKLLNDGYNFDFVGSFSDGENYDPLFDADHQGYNGRTTAELNDRVDTYLDTEDPQIILLHIGTNDLRKAEYDISTSTNNVKSILDKIYAHNANIKVLLARIIDTKPNNPDVTIFNDSVEAMANVHIADIDIVDMEDGAGIDYTTEMQDEFHPNNDGYAKMADLWYSSLQTVIPMHQWKLEEATGATTYLDSYREANGTCVGNGCPIAVTGKTGNAQEFDGIEDKIDVMNTATFDWVADANVTIEFWMQTNTTAGNLYEVMIGRKGPGGGTVGPDDRWYVGVKTDTGQITYGLGNSSGNEVHGTGASVVADGDWHHIVYVVTVDRIMLYVDGAIDVNIPRGSTVGEHVQGTNVNIGYLNQGNRFEYTGLLDEVTVYDGALSEAQIKKRYGALEITTDPVTLAEVSETYSYDVNSSNDPSTSFALNINPNNWLNIDSSSGLIDGTPDATGNFDVQVEAVDGIETAIQDYVLKVRDTSSLPSGMEHYWKLDETAGSPYIDAYLGADATCTDPGCPVDTTVAKVGGAQEFDGITGRLNVTDTATFDWAVNDSFTIEFWMKANPTAGNDYEVMIGRQGPKEGAIGDRWYVGVKTDTGRITYGLGNSNGDGVDGIGSSVVGDGDWYHVAYVVTSARIMIYVNSAIDVNRTRGDSVGEYIQGTNVNIGYLNEGDRYEYTGLLDEIAVFDSALGVTEIEQHYEKGKIGLGFDDDAYSVSIAKTTDGAEPGTDASFTVSVTPANATGAAITGNIAYSGTATNGTDYATGTATFSIADGSSTAVITLATTDDALVEGTETITATISSPSTGTLGTDNATADLTDNDVADVTKPVITPIVYLLLLS